MFDPTSPIPRAPEVRVTMRGVRLTPDGAAVQVSTRSDFIAPDLSPVSTLATELAKGARYWSEGTTPEDKRPQHLIRAEKARKALLDADNQALTVGTTVIRHTSASTGKVLNRTGPKRKRRG